MKPILTFMLLSVAAALTTSANEATDSITSYTEAQLDSLITSLNEVTVTAQRPLVTKEIDRIGYDVQADDESKTATLSDILRKVPLVSVDPDGTIKVKGSSDFKIYRNGRPNNSYSKNAKELFKAIPASSIKKIEVITDPGAREDAEGTSAILNIVTMSDLQLKGVTGQVSLSTNSKSHWAPNPNLYITTQINKVILSAYGGCFFQQGDFCKDHTESRYVYDETGNVLTGKSQRRYPGGTGWFGIDGSYELDSLNLFTMEFNGYTYRINQHFDQQVDLTLADGTPGMSYRALTTYRPITYFDLGGGINYQRSTRRKGETITASYLLATTRQHSDVTEEYSDKVNASFDYDSKLSNTRANFIEHTLQLDWARPINAHNKFDTGTKYIYRNNHSYSTYDYIPTASEYTNFKHTTQVGAIYGDYRLNVKRWNFRAGLRFEYSRLKGHNIDPEEPAFCRSLRDWVPNASISVNINDENTLKISYNERINRPGITYLNPAVNSSPVSVSQGNPDLVSARYRSINLNYSLIKSKINIDLTAGYTTSTDGIVSVQQAINDVMYSSYANVGHNRTFNTNLYVQWSPFEKTTWILNGGLYYRYFKNPDYQLSHVMAHGWNGWIWTQVRQKLPWKLTASVSFNTWKSGATSAYSSLKSYHPYYYSLNLQRSFLKDDRLTVTATAMNPFGPKGEHNRAYSFNQGRDGYQDSWSSYYQSFQLQVSYRFGSLNASVKKTASTIKNEDVVGAKVGK
ncbi:MAG: outer membrane beta-barrel family protein [Bacteroidales bacterium]|nr:outer membrane beta-barrel family protein [Bacteroidales bacterium]